MKLKNSLINYFCEFKFKISKFSILDKTKADYTNINIEKKEFKHIMKNKFNADHYSINTNFTTNEGKEKMVDFLATTSEFNEEFNKPGDILKIADKTINGKDAIQNVNMNGIFTDKNNPCIERIDLDGDYISSYIEKHVNKNPIFRDKSADIIDKYIECTNKIRDSSLDENCIEIIKGGYELLKIGCELKGIYLP